MTVMAFRNKPVPDRPGYAWLEIDAAVRPDVKFSLSCPSRTSKTYLGPGGWQGSPYEWTPVEVEGAATGARLQVGPPIVDQLFEDLLVRIEIPSAGYRADTQWDFVPVSGTPRGDPSIDQSSPEIASGIRENAAVGYRDEASDSRVGIRDSSRHQTGDSAGGAARNGARDGATEQTRGESRDQFRPETRTEVKTETKTEEKRETRTDTAAGDDAARKRSRLIAVAAVLAGLIIGATLGYLYVGTEHAAAATTVAADPRH
jgi:hypothetical protein